MNKLTEKLFSDKTQWCLPENKERILSELRESISRTGEITRIEDIFYPGEPDRFGNTVMKRCYYGPNGGFALEPFRGHVYLEPLKKNPMTLENVQ